MNDPCEISELRHMLRVLAHIINDPHVDEYRRVTVMSAARLAGDETVQVEQRRAAMRAAVSFFPVVP